MGLNIVNNLANKLYLMLFNSIGLDKNQEQIVLYMLKLIVKNSFMWLIVFLISLPLGAWWTTLFFMLSFMAIRHSFGGWHSKNEYICFVVSIFGCILAGYVSKIININLIIYVLVYLFSLIVALKVGVVDNPTKRLSIEKKERFKRRGLIILAMVFFINILFVKLGLTNFSNAVLLGVLIGFINLLFGK